MTHTSLGNPAKIDYLYEELEKSKKYVENPIVIPEYITRNLKFDLFYWQREALENFLLNERNKERGNHLMFNMATGTGKTLLMAALLLYYYKQGYRKVIFFVNQNNIVGKTEDNLSNPGHNKYLFQPIITIDQETVNIKKVEVFSDRDDVLEIKFCSIQKLHNDVYNIKENTTTLQELQERDIIMIADEAHHLNANTKNETGVLYGPDFNTSISETNAKEEDIERGWENTAIQLLLNKYGYRGDRPNKNILLEFTATIPEVRSVLQKYADKTVYKFQIEDFLRAGYTKEIHLVSSSFDKRLRILQALLFNWYRQEIAIKFHLYDFKSVILFRSKTIEASQADFAFFRELIDNLSISDFDFIGTVKEEELDRMKEVYRRGQSRIMDIRRYIADNRIEVQSIIEFLQTHFKVQNCIITNSSDRTAKGKGKGEEKTTESQDRLLNNLEDRNNIIRAVFSVQRLTEGWDVLNLYDIVRLYEGQNTGGSNVKKSATSRATTQEVQLIGRGIRYYPFSYGDKERGRRKFDDDLTHELRVLEEFYFHSDNDERYIGDLIQELKRKNLIEDRKIRKVFGLKEAFRACEFYRKAKLFKNERIVNPFRQKKSLDQIEKEWYFACTIIEEQKEAKILFDDNRDDEDKYVDHAESKTLLITIRDMERHIVMKAINRLSKQVDSVYRIGNLSKELKVESIDELYDSGLLAGLPLSVTTNRALTHNDYLKIAIRFFEQLEQEIKKYSRPYTATCFKSVALADVFEKSKEKLVEANYDKEYEKSMVANDWYVLDAFVGTDEERDLLEFIKGYIGNLKSRYDEVYLLRNEEIYKIYDREGRGFMPDFLLFLRKGDDYFQVFVEPKGSDRLKTDQWKNDFLQAITTEDQNYIDRTLMQQGNKSYRLIGIPLYNSTNTKKEVETCFVRHLLS